MLCLLATVSTCAAFNFQLSASAKKPSVPKLDVRPAVTDVGRVLREEDDTKEAADEWLYLASNSAIVGAMREEVVGLTAACLLVLFFPMPANAVEMSNVFTTPTTLVVLLLGIVAVFYAGLVANAIISSTEAIVAMISPALINGVKRSESLAGTVAYKDFLAGRPLPTIEELSDACVLIASGSHGDWSLCSMPKGPSCEPDDVFTAYYGQPVYVCRM